MEGIEGRVGNSTTTNGKLLSVFTNTTTGGGDAINYFGKVSNSDNIQTKTSVEALIAAAGGGYKITESGGQFFIESN